MSTCPLRYIQPIEEENATAIPAANLLNVEDQERRQQRRVSTSNIDVEWDDSKSQLREATEEDMRVLLQEEAMANAPPVPEKVRGRQYRSVRVMVVIWCAMGFLFFSCFGWFCIFGWFILYSTNLPSRGIGRIVVVVLVFCFFGGRCVLHRIISF